MQININPEELRNTVKLFVATPMYGGFSHGLYLKSCLDLQTLCSKHGIECRFSFLFNESLITRARNYLVDEFLRSDCTHLMFIDADINYNPIDILALLTIDKDIIGAPYPKKCCSSKTKVTTEDGIKTIKEIVDTKYMGKALSQNIESGKFEWKPITAHWVEDKGGKKWVTIVANENVGSPTVTDDHLCLVTDSVLFPRLKYEEAKNIIGKYMIAPPQSKKGAIVNALYTPDQLQFLIGSLLGDGSISKQGYLKFGYSLVQEKYLELKASLFGSTPSKIRNVGFYKGKEYFAKFLECPRNAQIEELRELMYVDGKKTVKNIVNMIDEKSLAFWYFDDGSMTKQSTYRKKTNKKTRRYEYTVNISTQGFATEDISLLQEVLFEKFHIKTGKLRKSNGSYAIHIYAESQDAFFNLISKYTPQGLEYKIPEKFRLADKYVYSFERLPYGASRVKSLRRDSDRIRRSKKLYDICVDDNHNFVADGFVVHNSINWNAVWTASKKLLANPNFVEEKFNPSELEGVTGEYVFNPVPGTTKFSVLEPIEVMEIGTGFMLIKRGVFEKFKEEYPHLQYKPDHKYGSFDGSKYIHAFFDTVIDPDSHRYLSEDYMFSFSRNTLVETEDGVKTIGEIVDTDYNGKVLSYDQLNQKNVWKSIIGKSKRKNNGKRWIRLDTDRDNNRKSKLICTHDHKVAYFDDIFNPVMQGYTDAENMTNKFMLRNPKGYENKLFNKDQMSALLGTLLGDATIGKNGQVLITHGKNQLEYNEYKCSLFGGTLNKGINRGFGKDMNCSVVHLPVNLQTNELRNILYSSHSKTIEGVIEHINEISLAFWYMDDGHLLSANKAELHTEGFSDNDQEMLVSLFKRKWDIDCEVGEKCVTYNNREKIFKYLRILDGKKFFKTVAPYIHQSMKYKIPNEYHAMTTQLNTELLDFAGAKVISATELKNYHSMLYDIGVEDTYNFYASGTLAHNCQYWRAIGGKVWLCPWMKNQHIGTYAFTGDLPKIAQLNGSL